MLENMEKKDEAAVAMNRKRWRNSTPEERRQHVAAMGRKRWEGKTFEERAAHCRMMAEAKAKKQEAKS
jgi:hypothetical protein